MTIRISETIHKWMGWCPVKSGITIPAGTEGYETKPGRSPRGPERTGMERTIDYGSSGSSLLNLLMFGAGIAAIVFGIKFVSLFFIGADAIVLFCFLFASAFILAYSDLKKTRIETDHENLIIYRPVFRPVIIPKEEISAVEMHDNHRPVLYWLVHNDIFTCTDPVIFHNGRIRPLLKLGIRGNLHTGIRPVPGILYQHHCFLPCDLQFPANTAQVPPKPS